MGIYSDNGYLNFEHIYNDKRTFIFMIGARAIGKTFGALSFCLERKLKFIYLRTKAETVKKLSNVAFNPFKPVNDFYNRDIVINNKKTGGITQFIDRQNDNEIIGYMLPLSTFSNFRGFDLSDIDIIIYDEFIPETDERPLKNQAAILFNAYETSNRNRELQGRKPIKLVCMSNANTIFNDIFLYLKITKKVYDMHKKHKMYFYDDSKELSIYCLFDSPISQQKKETALYKLTSGSQFEAMAIDNEYIIANEELIKPQNITGFKPVCCVGECYFYVNGNNAYYMTTFKKGVFVKTYSNQENSLLNFKHNNYQIWSAFLDDRLYFEDIYCLEYFNMIY